MLVGALDAVDEQDEAGDDSARPEEIEPASGGARGGGRNHLEHADRGREADRHVDQEHPLPAEAGGQDAAQHDASRGAGAADRAPSGQHRGALASLIGGRDDRKRAGREHRRAESPSCENPPTAVR